MSKHYHHLTQEQRYTISFELKSGKPKGQIAQDLGISRQTLWRELARNTGGKGYRPAQAHSKALARSQNSRRVRLNAFARAFIVHKIREQEWSPEQISHRLALDGWQGVPSPEWIYQFVYSKAGQDESLRAFLRCQKTYRKRGYQTQDRRGKLPLSSKASIHERPNIIEQRLRTGDLEGDTLIGKNHKGALLSLVDRTSLYTWLKHLPNRNATNTADACINALKQQGIHSITFDNGKEFAQHQRIAQATGAAIYFADPYHSNQRARNENTNGLIRQYFPKYLELISVCPKYVQNVADKLNHRPRKSLNWLTPAQVMAGFSRVALQT